MKRFLTLAVLSAGLGSAPAAGPELVNGILAVVNRTIITEKEAREFIEPALMALQRQPGLSPQDYNDRARDIYKDGLGQLVERQLMLDDFKTAGYSFPESIIEDFVQDRIRERYGDRVKLIKTLEAQNMTYEQFRTDIRDQPDQFGAGNRVAQPFLEIATIEIFHGDVVEIVIRIDVVDLNNIGVVQVGGNVCLTQKTTA